MSEILLKDGVITDVHFPDFAHIPDHYDTRRKDGGIHSIPVKTWCLLLEVEKTERDIVNALVVFGKDRSGKSTFVYFEKGLEPQERILPGMTICVFFAERHMFKNRPPGGNFRHGVKQEYLDTFKVVNLPLQDVLSAMLLTLKKVCWNCSSDGRSLQFCAKCKQKIYCKRECQLEDWGNRHKKWCKRLHQLEPLLIVDYTNDVTYKKNEYNIYTAPGLGKNLYEISSVEEIADLNEGELLNILETNNIDHSNKGNRRHKENLVYHVRNLWRAAAADSETFTQRKNDFNSMKQMVDNLGRM